MNELKVGDRVELLTGFSPVMTISYIYCDTGSCHKKCKCNAYKPQIAYCQWFEHDDAKDIWDLRYARIALNALRRVQ